jgi:hypothetical protein
MSGKRARKRANRAAQGMPAAHTAANSKEATAARANLFRFVTKKQKIMGDELDAMVENQFGGGGAALAAAAEEGDARAQFAMMMDTRASFRTKQKWMDRLFNQGNPTYVLDAELWFIIADILGCFIDADGDRPECEEKKQLNAAVEQLKGPVASGSATAQHVVGLLQHYFACQSGSKAGSLDTVRWKRQAAMQDVREAQILSEVSLVAPPPASTSHHMSNRSHSSLSQLLLPVSAALMFVVLLFLVVIDFMRKVLKLCCWQK